MSKRLTPEELEKAAAEGREMRQAIQQITREMEAPPDDYARGIAEGRELEREAVAPVLAAACRLASILRAPEWERLSWTVDAEMDVSFFATRSRPPAPRQPAPSEVDRG